jgi:hypothetical protein
LVANKVFSPEGLNMKKEEKPLERRVAIIEKTEKEAYKETLELLAGMDNKYIQYLSKPLSNILKRKILLALWVKMGNQIPCNELSEDVVKKFLKQKGFVFKRIKNGLGWYYNDEYVAKDYCKTLKHLEKNEKVDRTKLIIKF